MAKQVKRPAPDMDMAPGADPKAKYALLSHRMGSIMGCCCLLMFIVFEELWIGTLAFALGFAVIFCIEVFYEKSKVWYASYNLYLTALCLALAYLEYVFGILSNLLTRR